MSVAPIEKHYNLDDFSLIETTTLGDINEINLYFSVTREGFSATGIRASVVQSDFNGHVITVSTNQRPANVGF